MTDHFFIGIDEKTIWKSSPVSTVVTKTKARNIIKVKCEVKGKAKHVSTELESFFTFINVKMFDNIVTCTHLYIENRKETVHYHGERYCKLTSHAKI